MMRRNVTTLVALSLVFVILLILAGSCEGVLADVVYYAAFVIPMAIGLIADRRQRRAEAEHDREYKEPQSILSLGRESTRLMLPLAVPTVALTALAAYVTSLAVTAATGARNAVDVGDSLAVALIAHALVPAVLEEALFRYLPMRMLARYGAHVTVIVSSACFSLVHADVFQIPYALLAGVLFMSIDLICESVWPSVIMHFMNNSLSVLYIMYSDADGFDTVYFTALAALILVSFAFIIIMRKRYLERVRALVSVREPLEGMGALIALAAPMILIAITSL